MSAMHVRQPERETGIVQRVMKTGKIAKKNPRARGRKERDCYRCGRVEYFTKDPTCPARGQECRKCKGTNNFAKMFKTKNVTTKTAKYVSRGIERNYNNQYYAFMVKDCDSYRYGVDLDMLIDSGATSNIIDKATW